MSESIIIALIGIGGAIVGSVSTMGASWLMHVLKEKSEYKKDEPARALLKEMLNHNNYTWRNLDVLRHVIGCDAGKTKQLLLQIEARASENGDDTWALKKRAPLNKG